MVTNSSLSFESLTSCRLLFRRVGRGRGRGVSMVSCRLATVAAGGTVLAYVQYNDGDGGAKNETSEQERGEFEWERRRPACLPLSRATIFGETLRFCRRNATESMLAYFMLFVSQIRTRW